MKAQLFSLLFLLVYAFCFVSCDDSRCIKGEGPIVTKNLTVPDFTAINLAGSMGVTISQGTEQLVTAKGHANIIDKIKTQVVDGKWYIEFEDGCYKDAGLEINVVIPKIIDISITGSGSVMANDFSNQDNLILLISGSGSITLNDFDGPEMLEAEIAGSGNIHCNGDIGDLENLKTKIVGSGSFSGFPAIAHTCAVDIEGSGNAEVFATDQLTANIIGSGSIYYKGNPNINSTISGSGKLINAN